MDDLNNNNNPFGEENNSQRPDVPSNSDPYAGQTGGQQYTNPYADHQANQQYTNPYANQQGNQQYTNPYAGQQSNQQYTPPPQYDPYNQQPERRQNPYSQPMQGNPYQQQNAGQGYSMPQQGYQQAYQQSYGYANPYQPRPSTGMAVASLVLGIVSIMAGIFMFALPVLFLMPIIGLILGIVFKTKRLPVGKGLSTAGIVTSALGLILPIILVIIVGVWAMSSSGSEFMRMYMERLKTISPEQYEEYYDQLHDIVPQWFSSAVRYISTLLKF